MTKKYWKPTTPEQIAEFKARRVLINKRAKDKIKMKNADLPKPPPRVSVLAGLTPEQIKARQAEQKRKSREKIAALNPKPKKQMGRPKKIVTGEVKAPKVMVAKEVKVVTPKPAKLRVDKSAKPPITRLPNRPHDCSKVKVRLDSRTEIYTNPGYCLQSLRAKYGIAV